MTIGVAEEATIASAGNNRACSNGGSGENECGSGKRIRARTEYGAPPRWDPFTMEVDRGRNCYACGGFGHMACNCRNRERVVRRVEIEGGRFEGNIEQIGHLKEVENLEALD